MMFPPSVLWVRLGHHRLIPIPLVLIWPIAVLAWLGLLPLLALAACLHRRRARLLLLGPLRLFVLLCHLRGLEVSLADGSDRLEVRFVRSSAIVATTPIDSPQRLRPTNKEIPMGQEQQRILQMLADGKINVEQASRLLEALSARGAAGEPAPAGEAPAKQYRFLRVQVEDGEDKVNVRVPLKLLQAGVKFKSLIPRQVSEALAEAGIDLNNASLGSNLDELVAGLGELSVDIQDGDDEKVRIFCE
jgi:hypothetical protein